MVFAFLSLCYFNYDDKDVADPLHVEIFSVGKKEKEQK